VIPQNSDFIPQDAMSEHSISQEIVPQEVITGEDIHEGAKRSIDQFLANSPTSQNFNPFVSNFIDEGLLRMPTGSTIPDPTSVLGESGRTYHGYKEGSYLMPNDAAEQDRLDIQHALWKVILGGKLGKAPMTTAPRLVLDLATGTGIWALEFARANPTSFVIGTDLSKIQPNPDVPNCIFERDDCEDDWVWPHKFDYVHTRTISGAIRDPERLIKQAYDALNPGGWLEMHEFSWESVVDEESVDDRVPTSYWCRLMEKALAALAKHGIDGFQSRHYKDWLIKTGCQ